MKIKIIKKGDRKETKKSTYCSFWISQ